MLWDLMEHYSILSIPHFMWKSEMYFGQLPYDVRLAIIL